MDKEGWVDVATLIRRINASGRLIDNELLDYVVETNSKKRFAFNENKERISASKGHSVDIELGYSPQDSPDIPFHGTRTP